MGSPVSSGSPAPALASGNVQKLSAQASVLNGASSVGSSSALSGRERAVSRDAEREALRDAADDELQAAAEKQARRAPRRPRRARRQRRAAGRPDRPQHLAAAGDRRRLPPDVATSASAPACGRTATPAWTSRPPRGTPIHAIANGTVTEVGYSGAYGNRTIVTLEDGTEMWYCHQTSYSVTTGQDVRAGEVIGSVGSTGNTTGPHVHVEVRPGAGDPVDPFTALVAHGVHP